MTPQITAIDTRKTTQLPPSGSRSIVSSQINEDGRVGFYLTDDRGVYTTVTMQRVIDDNDAHFEIQVGSRSTPPQRVRATGNHSISDSVRPVCIGEHHVGFQITDIQGRSRFVYLACPQGNNLGLIDVTIRLGAGEPAFDSRLGSIELYPADSSPASLLAA